MWSGRELDPMLWAIIALLCIGFAAIATAAALAE
jgi:hypothetical protein